MQKKLIFFPLGIISEWPQLGTTIFPNLIFLFGKKNKKQVFQYELKRLHIVLAFENVMYFNLVLKNCK